MFPCISLNIHNTEKCSKQKVWISNTAMFCGYTDKVKVKLFLWTGFTCLSVRSSEGRLICEYGNEVSGSRNSGNFIE